MKVTVKKKEAKAKKINYGDLEPGTVFKYHDGVLALKMTGNNAVLLTYCNGLPYCELADGYKTSEITEVLGMLDEIVVKEIA